MYIYIRSMSEAQTEIYRDIRNASDQITMHILKLLLYPTSSYVDHWMHEIWSFLYIVKKLKGKNKWPEADFIKKAMSTGNDIIPQFMAVVMDEESELEPTWIDPDDALACIEAYQDWIAFELSSYGVVRQSDVKAKLKEICNL